jgi:hypothetical protein
MHCIIIIIIIIIIIVVPYFQAMKMQAYKIFHTFVVP